MEMFYEPNRTTIAFYHCFARRNKKNFVLSEITL